MQYELIEATQTMSDQQVLNKVASLEKVVAEADNRTLRLGTRVEELKDFVQTDLNIRLAKVEERTTIFMWAFGFVVAVISIVGVQVFLMNGRLSGIERDVSNLVSSVNELKLRKAADNPKDTQNIDDVTRILSQSRSNTARISPKVIQETGEKFFLAAQENPYAWTAALACIAYNSFSNPFPVPGGEAEKTLIAGQTAYLTPAGAGPMYSVGSSKPPDVPQLRPYGDQDLNSNKTFGPQFLLIVGGTTELDGYYMKRVIFKNVHISYRGGAATLENVYFVDCTFDIVPQSRGQLLATKLLSSSLNVTASLV